MRLSLPLNGEEGGDVTISGPSFGAACDVGSRREKPGWTEKGATAAGGEECRFVPQIDFFGEICDLKALTGDVTSCLPEEKGPLHS